MGEKLLALVAESVIVQSIITVMLVGTFAYLCLVGKEPTASLRELTFLIVAYWMGTKQQHFAERMARGEKA